MAKVTLNKTIPIIPFATTFLSGVLVPLVIFAFMVGGDRSKILGMIEANTVAIRSNMVSIESLQKSLITDREVLHDLEQKVSFLYDNAGGPDRNLSRRKP